MGAGSGLRRGLATLGLLLAVALLYAQTAGHAFVDYDSGPYLTANEHVRGGLTRGNLVWAFTQVEAANWHPLTWISHMLDVELFGLAPAGHQLENVAWHAANALLVLLFFSRVGLPFGAAFLAALVFAVHPLRVESVAWVVERKDLLSSFFALLALLLWLDWSRRGGAPRLLLSCAAYAASLLAKPMFVTLPCLLLLLERFVLERRDWRPRARDLVPLGFGLAAAAVCVVTVAAQRAGGALQGLERFPLALRVENALASWVWYLERSFWPGELACHYPLARHEPGPSALLLDLALLSALTGAACLARRRVPLVLAGWLWFLGTLVPVIGLVQVGAQAHADRYAYFPTLGLLLAVAALVERELVPRLGARLPAALALAAALALGLRAHAQVATWRDTETLARHALAVTRDNAIAQALLGNHLVNTGRAGEALPFLREAAGLAPGDGETLANLGGALLRCGAMDEAAALLRRASELAPGRWQTWSLLGALELARGRPAEALAALERAAALEARDAGVWLNRGRALEALGRVEEARSSYQRSLACPSPLSAARAAFERLRGR